MNISLKADIIYRHKLRSSALLISQRTIVYFQADITFLLLLDDSHDTYSCPSLAFAIYLFVFDSV